MDVDSKSPSITITWHVSIINTRLVTFTKVTTSDCQEILPEMFNAKKRERDRDREREIQSSY